MKKHKNRTGLYIVIFLVGLMVLSVVGFITNSEEKVKYNKQSFTQKGGLWVTKINNQQLTFEYFPSELESIEVSNQILQLLRQTQMVYVTYNPENYPEQLAKAQFSLIQAFNINNVYAASALTNSTGTSLPEITCANATQYSPVIFIKAGDNSSINLNNNCIILNGVPQITAERLIYGIFGII